MKKLMMIVLTGCVVVISLGFKQVTADQGWTPLEQLAGTYSNTAQGSAATCFKDIPPPTSARTMWQCGFGSGSVQCPERRGSDV
jgi:hypothetical protein